MIQVPRSAAEAVAQGAQYLDEKTPGWHRLINLDTLNIADCHKCICGQLGVKLLGTYGYPATLAALGLPDQLFVYYDNNGPRRAHSGSLYGFDMISARINYEDLDEEWVKAIEARIQADAINSQVLTTPVPERELVTVG